jgi:hypothetical protein
LEKNILQEATMGQPTSRGEIADVGAAKLSPAAGIAGTKHVCPFGSISLEQWVHAWLV